MTTRSVARLRPEQCSACPNKFPWSMSEPTQLFPLLCGHIFCRLCLAKLVRNVLSSTDVPLQCCEKLVPNDYIRDVLADEENKYYLFLLNQARSSADSVKEANQKPDMTSPGSLPVSSSAHNVRKDLEMKPPPGNASATPLATQVNSTPQQRPARKPVEPRYITRTSKARLNQQQGGAIATSGSTSNDQSSVTPSREKYCKCNIWLDESPSIAPCGHRVCRKCLENGVQHYLDMSPLGNAVPVSCCGKVLPLDLVRRIISGRELMTYAKFMIKYSDATTPRTVGTKRKAAPEKQPAVVSQKAKGKPPAKRAKKGCIEADGSSRECIACSSPNKLRVGPCGHGYCQPCLKKMAKTSLSNRNQVPVRCCSKELPIEYVESVLTKNQFQQYQRYVSERDPKKSTLKSDRDYAAIVRKNKGKQCPVCGIGVVKVSGCHAMRCSLGHGFCWNCLQSICTCGRIYQYN